MKICIVLVNIIHSFLILFVGKVSSLYAFVACSRDALSRCSVSVSLSVGFGKPSMIDRCLCSDSSLSLIYAYIYMYMYGSGEALSFACEVGVCIVANGYHRVYHIHCALVSNVEDSVIWSGLEVFHVYIIISISRCKLIVWLLCPESNLLNYCIRPDGDILAKEFGERRQERY